MLGTKTLPVLVEGGTAIPIPLHCYNERALTHVTELGLTFHILRTGTDLYEVTSRLYGLRIYLSEARYIPDARKEDIDNFVRAFLQAHSRPLNS